MQPLQNRGARRFLGGAIGEAASRLFAATEYLFRVIRDLRAEGPEHQGGPL